MPGPALTPTDVINRFNTIVRSAASQIDGATWYTGNFPSEANGLNGGTDPVPSRLGARAEVTHTAADINPPGQFASTIVFNILHGFAMELTRVRKVHAWHRTDAAPIDGGTQTTALNSKFAAYFPIPLQPTIGSSVDDTQLTTFLGLLLTEVNKVRTGIAYTVDIVTCHNSCHASCHGSRSRR
jgi:putative component of membrane protein insertase Oxa1/YidC/SpoIIIJ protein YidD